MSEEDERARYYMGIKERMGKMVIDGNRKCKLINDEVRSSSVKKRPYGF